MDALIDIPQRKTFADLGLDAFGQSPLVFSKRESNKQQQTMAEAGLPAKFIIDGNEGWIQKGQTQVLLNPGQDIQVALDSATRMGGGKVVLSPGIYNVSKDITITSGVTLEGTNTVSTIIDFGGLAHSIKSHGTDEYLTGTVSVNVGATTVTGSGTAWTTDMIGQNISLEGIFDYVITDVTSATSLTIDSEFVSTSGNGNLSGATYAIATVISSGVVNNLTIRNSIAPAISLKYTTRFVSDFVFIDDCQYGILAEFSGALVKQNGGCTGCDYGYYIINCDGFSILSDYVYSTTVGHGLSMQNSGDATIFNTSFSSCAGNGINLVNAYNTGFVSFASNDNAGKGVEFVSVNNDIELFGAVIGGNGSDGIKLTATSDESQFSGLTLKNNGGYGLNIAASSCDNNVFVGNVLTGNSSGQSTDAGTGTRFSGNVGVADN